MSTILVNNIKDTGNNTLLTSDGSGTVTLGSGFPDNTPAFLGYLSGFQTVTDSTTTKVDLNTVQIDTHSAFDTSNNRFTVPSGQAGTYQLYSQSVMGNTDGSASNLRDHYFYIYKNGSAIVTSDNNPNASWWAQNTHHASGMFDLAVGDYIELYVYVNVGTGNGRLAGIDTGSIRTFLYGCKIIGA